MIGVKKGANSHPVSSQKKALLFSVIDGDRKLAIKIGKATDSLFFIEMENNFGIRLGRKNMA